QSAQVDLLKSVFPNDQWIGFLPGDHVSGSGQAVVRQGTGFDPFSRYRTQLVLNRGTDVEVKSDSHDLNAYLVAPFGLDFRSRHTIAEHARQPDDIDLAKELGAEKAELTTVISNGLVAAGQACGGLPADLSMIKQGSGACFWKPSFAADPVGTCAAFQPGVSDHDYELFIPSSYPNGDCLVKELSKAADGAKIGDVSFFSVPKNEFQDALLNILPPVAGGNDLVGDMGLGRQSLL